jgi:NSS family neurotransmitter:Na+ symporter
MPKAAADQADTRPQWSGQVGFVLAAMGSAIGLGNIWRFPRVAYENGGGAFLIPYLVAFFTAGLPILWLDYAIGHRFRGSPPLALRRISKKLEALGWYQVMINFFISLYYAAVLAWALSFFVFSFGQKWGADTEEFFYDDYLHRAAGAGFSFDFVPGVAIPLAVVWIAVLVIVALGVTRGVEKASLVAVPLLIVGFITMVARAMYLPGAEIGLDEFFHPEFDRLLDAGVWVAAYGQIFFTLSIAYGIMVTYSSYRRRKANQTTTGLVVALANSSFEMLAGIGVFCVLGYMATKEPGVEIEHLVGDSGAGLAFITFPRVIAVMPGATFFGLLFFGSLLVAGFTSLISNIQVCVGAVEDKFGFGAVKAALTVGLPMAVLSLVLFGTTTGFYTLDTMDHWTNEIGIVASAILLTVTVVWVAKKGRELTYHLTALSTIPVGRTWRFMIGIFNPVVLTLWLTQMLVTTIRSGFHSYPKWFLGVDGWGVVILSVVGGIVFTTLRWRSDPDDFVPWPQFTGKELVESPLVDLILRDEQDDDLRSDYV